MYATKNITCLAELKTLQVYETEGEHRPHSHVCESAEGKEDIKDVQPFSRGIRCAAGLSL